MQATPQASPTAAPEAPESAPQEAQPQDSSITPVEAPIASVWIDLELYRLAYTVSLQDQYMMYLLARSVMQGNRAHIDDILAASSWGQSYTYELLSLSAIASGQHPFYRGKNGKWLYLRGEVDIATRMAQAVKSEGLDDVLDSRLPGMRKRSMPVSSTVHDVYAAWLDSKKTRRISREVLAQLWNVTEKTTKRWHYTAGIEASKNFAQSANLRDERLPADRPDFEVATIGGQTVAMWQLANTYHTPKTYREHPHKGQARKVRKAVNAVLITDQQADSLAAMHPYRNRLFYGNGNRLQAMRDYTQAVKKRPFAETNDYLFIGPRRSISHVDIYELLAPRPQQTAPATYSGRYEGLNS
jgi:hypothetical protein